MVKWVRLTKNQWFGLFAVGILLFLLQELPYAVMPLIPLEANPLMEMRDKSLVLNAAEKTLGISCVLTMIFLVRGDAVCFSLRTAQEKGFFGGAVLALLGYYGGWAAYYGGLQTPALMLGALVALPPVYYALIGLWRGNTPLAVLGGLFLPTHLANVWNNLR